MAEKKLEGGILDPPAPFLRVNKNVYIINISSVFQLWYNQNDILSLNLSLLGYVTNSISLLKARKIFIKTGELWLSIVNDLQ